MSDDASDLTQDVETVESTPEPEQAAESPDAQTDADLDAALDEQAIEIPDGDKLVPLSAVQALRGQVKQLKTQAAKSGDLEAQVAVLQGQMSAQNPILQAAQALLAAQQAQPAAQTPQGPSPEALAELEAIARDLDLYQSDGKPDLARAYRIHQRTVNSARAIAEQATKPIIEHSASQEVDWMIERAKVTEWQGQRADPVILESHVNKIRQQPGGLQMLANQEYMTIVWKQALLDSLMAGKAVKTPTRVSPQQTPEAGAPVFREKSGGASGPRPKLSSMETRAAADLGMTQDEYQKEVAKMPW